MSVDQSSVAIRHSNNNMSVDPSSVADDMSGSSALALPLSRPVSRQEAQRRTWMLTYCPPGTYITAEMLLANNIKADEVHSTADRVMNYTYVHLTKKVRRTAMEAFLRAVRVSHGVIQSEVFGYDSLVSEARGGERIQDHVVFMMLAKHCMEKEVSFSPWTDGQPVLVRGPLFQAVNGPPPVTVARMELWTRRQLLEHVTELQRRLGELEERRAEQSLEFTSLSDAFLERRAQLWAENQALRERVTYLEEAMGLDG